MGPAPAPSTLFESTQPIEPPRYDAIDARYSALGRVRTYLETAARAQR